MEFKDFQSCTEALSRITSEDVELTEYYPFSSFTSFYSSTSGKEDLNAAESALKDNLLSAGLISEVNKDGETSYEAANLQATIIWAIPDSPGSSATEPREDKIISRLSSYLYSHDSEYQKALSKDWVNLPQTRKDSWKNIYAEKTEIEVIDKYGAFSAKDESNPLNTFLSERADQYIFNIAPTTPEITLTPERTIEPIALNSVTSFDELIAEPELSSSFEIRRIGMNNDLYILDFKDSQTCKEAIDKVNPTDGLAAQICSLLSFTYRYNYTLEKNPLNPTEKNLQEYLLAAGLIKKVPLLNENVRYEEKDPDARVIWIISDSSEISPDEREKDITHELSHYIFDNDPDYQSKIFESWINLPEAKKGLWENVLMEHYKTKIEQDENNLLEEYGAYSVENKNNPLNAILIQKINAFMLK